VEWLRSWWQDLKTWAWSRLVALAEIAGREAGCAAREYIADAITEALRKTPMAVTSQYVAGVITLTNASTAYNILNLIRTQIDANCPGAARSFNLYAAHANSALVYVGSGKVSNTNYAYVLNADDMREYDSDYQNVIFGALSAFSTSPGMQLGVEVMAS
jgi:hypothetical protein